MLKSNGTSDWRKILAMAGNITNVAQMKEPRLKWRQQLQPKCLVLNIFVLHFLCSCWLTN